MASVITLQRWSNLSEYMTLTEAIGADDTSITVDDDNDLYPITGSEYLVASFGDSKTGEIIHIYELLGSNVCAVTRGQEGTTAQAWIAGTRINIRVTAGSLNALATAIGSCEDRLDAQEAVPAFCTVYSAVEQELADATTTAVAFEEETTSTDPMHDTETNNSRVAAPITGTYFVCGSVEFEANATGYRELAIRKEGTTIQALNRVANLGGSDTTPVFVSAAVYLEEDEYVELVAKHTAGGPLSLMPGNGGPQLVVQLIRGHGIPGGGS